MNWHRARTKEKKDMRRESIYNAAFTLFTKVGYENVSFNKIAITAGFTKSNLYRYYSSKEEIFLKIFSNLFKAWVDNCLITLAKLEKNLDISKFAKAYVSSLKQHKKLLDLSPMLFISLEKNSSLEQLIDFKKVAKIGLHQIALEICRIYSNLSIGDAFEYLNLSFAASTSYWAASFQNDTLKKIYQMSEFKVMDTKFDMDLASAIEIILLGLNKKK